MIQDQSTRRLRRSILILAGFVCLAGCAPQRPLIEQEGRGAHREAVTYAGTIPCADCPGQRIVLTLFPDFTFRLRQTYIEATDGRDEDFYHLGRWARAEDDGDRLRLRGGKERGWQFRFLAPNRLRMLDNEGNEACSALNYDLARQTAVDPVAGPMRLRGMYVYMADAAAFTECLTGKRYPVAIEADHVALERAYLAARRQPGDPVLAAFDGRFVERAPEPGAAAREHLTVERFDRLWLGETCAADASAQADLLE